MTNRSGEPTVLDGCGVCNVADGPLLLAAALAKLDAINAYVSRTLNRDAVLYNPDMYMFAAQVRGIIEQDFENSLVRLAGDDSMRTEMKKFKEVIKETRRIAVTHPLNRNSDSEYFNVDGTPCCIFGYVLERFGISHDHMVDSGLIAAELSWSEWGFESPNLYEAKWITAVQVRADLGDSWIISVASADISLI